ncbi:ATP-dependent helicase [Vagococcus coleopterorum]|uniref:ATP-dependent helicase/deoxyribonuclease subunit B n=1 Tax=Vagococcus coleopterorum TaxID=2714946 RepID=A0A6G8ANS8_9ENTE|nr:PD-(D/E)XK nuclease family protein [Vagococcus coleopterorum]QIL46656.1 ATP-dependent helicase [Vagococcus coleopterorum]
MGLEFIIGSASADRETPLVEKARDWLVANPNHEVFYLVPNHIKFETEVSVLNKLHTLEPFNQNKRMASLQLQVFSFTRLAWYYLQNTEGFQSEQVSEAANLMLIRKVLLENSESLTVFKGEVTKPGFIQQLADLFNELLAGNVQETDLTQLITELGNSPKEADFKTKLTEFNYLYQLYLENLAGRQIGITQQISQLAQELPKRDLSQVMFIISGFSRFTAREQELIQTLVSNAAEVKVNLVLDKSYSTELPDSQNMFYDAGKVYFDLYQFARREQVKVYQDTKVGNSEASDLAMLEDFWVQSQELSSKKFDGVLKDNQIKLFETPTSYSEMTEVAGEIRRLVASGEYRYRDIEILTRDLATYEKIIAPIFDNHAIPFYVNNELAMKHHPLLELLINLFNIDERYYRYNDIMRLLRTELMMPSLDSETDYLAWQDSRKEFREKIDLTENVSLAYGYEGFYWTQEKDWLYITYDYNEGDVELDSDQKAQLYSNEVRNHLRRLLVPFYEKMAKAETAIDGATILYEFLVESGVEQEVNFWRRFAIEEGNLEEAKIHEQTWQALMNLLDDYVNILGDMPFDFKEFTTIVTTGLEGLTYSKVPTTLDQVTLSSIDMIHEQKNKVTFMVGMTDTTFPKKIENKTLLSDEERQLVSGHLENGKYLAKETKADLAKEPYIAYLAFHSTADKLYLSYPMGIEGSKDVKVSPYMQLIAKGLSIPIERKGNQVTPEKFEIERISTYRNLISDLLRLKKEAQAAGEFLAPEYVALEKQLLKDPEYQQLSQKLFASLVAKNITETLNQEMVDALYSSTIHGSVSKVENFHQCQYKYFMTYGLKLKERDTFELSPAATGDFYHDALDQLFKVLIREKLMLSELTSDDLNSLTNEVLENVLGEDKFTILSASPRMNYIRYQLSQTIKRVSETLRQQSLRTGMTTVQTEVIFGQIAQTKGLEGLKIDLPNNKALDIRGKIDRLDQIQVGDQNYLAVVDYKSSRHSFDYRDAYFGLAMQMITYLDVALQNAATLVGSEQAKPAGAFYLQVKNPTVDGSLAPEKAQEELLKEFSYKGLLLEDEQLLNNLDRTLDENPRSSVFPYYEKKNGDYSSSQFVSEQDIQLLIEKNRENFKEAGTEIFKGETKLNPAYRDKTRLACQFCNYRSICQFDVLLKENNYNRVEPLKKEDVMARLKPKETEE